jgi:hypothetical protein
MLTLHLVGYPVTVRVDRDIGMTRDSGGACAKGTVKFRLLKPPLLDSFFLDDQIGMDLLPSNSTELGMDHSDGSPENCWRPLWWFARDRED